MDNGCGAYGTAVGWAIKEGVDEDEDDGADGAVPSKEPKEGRPLF